MYPAVSRDVVKYLQRRGMTLRQIGEVMGLSESFISHVLHGRRSLTLRHLARLEKAERRPLALILMESADPESAPPELKAVYEAFRGLMAALGGFPGSVRAQSIGVA